MGGIVQGVQNAIVDEEASGMCASVKEQDEWRFGSNESNHPS